MALLAWLFLRHVFAQWLDPAQLDSYLGRLGLDTGWLVIFDQRAGLPPIEDRTSAAEAVTPGGRRVTVVRG